MAGAPATAAKEEPAMSTRTLPLLACLVLCACGVIDSGSTPVLQAPMYHTAPGMPARQASGPSTPVLRLEPAAIIDASGFEQPMAAQTLFLPQGWQVSGGVYWGREFLCTNGMGFNWQAVSPDGSTTIALLPQAHWEASNYGASPSLPGCGGTAFTSVRQFLEAAVQGWRPGARILDFRPRPDIVGDMAQMNRTDAMPMGEVRTWVEAGEVLFGFQQGGTEMRGSMAALATFHLSRSDSGMGMVMESLSADSQPAYAVSAPDGRLDFAFFEAIRRSITPNPQWLTRVGQHNRAIAQVSIEESRRQSEMLLRSNAEVARIRNEAWAATQTSADRRAFEFGEALRGVQTYADAAAPGGRVELSSGYDSVWRLDDGSYLLSRDAGFDPWRELNLNGQRLGTAR